METKTLFIVIASGGEYDDAWQENCVATFDKEKAEQYIAEQKKADAQHNEIVQAIRDFNDKFDLQTKLPSPNIRNVPKWPTGMRRQDITSEMLEERERIKQENAALWAEYGKKREEIQDKQNKECLNCLLELGYSKEEIESPMMKPYKIERDFEIETLEVI